MENNENNVQNQVNDVQKDIKQEGQAKKGGNKAPKMTVVLVTAIIILVVGIGIGGGFLLANKDKKDSGNSNTATNNTSTEATTSNEAEVKSGKKIDESKPWVYDAEYKKENKTIYSDSAKNEEYAVNSDKCFVVPYININSDAAKRVNENIKELYEDYYSRFGTEYINPYNSDYKNYNYYTIKYNKYINDSILSVVITLSENLVVVDGGTGGGTFTKYTYNFNLDTLNEATLDEMAKKCGFTSEYAVTSKIKAWEEKQRNILMKADQLDIFKGVQNGKYFIDENGKLNFLFRFSTSATGDSEAVIEPDKEIEFFYTAEQAQEQIRINNEEKQNQTTNQTENKTSNSVNKLEIAQLKNCTYENEKVNGQRYYKITFDGNGSPTIHMETIGKEMTTTVLNNQSFNSIKQDVAAGTTYITFEYDGIPGTGEIKYSNVTDNESIYVKLDASTNYIELKKVK